MKIIQLSSGGDRNFSYIIVDDGGTEAAVVDPGNPPSDELAVLKREGLRLHVIIGTHGHPDHTWGIEALARLTGAPVAMHPEAPFPHTIDLPDGAGIPLGGSFLRIIHTPGHTPDSLCILAGTDLLTGDTLFAGKVGGTGFGDDAQAEYDSLHEKLMTLPAETRIWPGHDYGVRRMSTIGEELRENPFILRESFESFLDLKKNWAEYKRIHGIR